MTAALPVVRVKNKFAFERGELRGGYRDLMLSVLFEEPKSGLRIIGEIQVRPPRHRRDPGASSAS